MENIVFVAPFAIEPRGTVRARMLPIARELATREYEVTVVIPPWDNPTYSNARWETDGVEVVNVRFDGGLLEHLNVISRVVRAIRAENPDLVHVFKPIAHSGTIAMLFGLHRRLTNDCPVVLDTDDWEGEGGQNERSRRSRPEELVMDFQERLTPRLMDVVTVASRTLETQVWATGIDSERVCYLPNGQRADRYDFEDASPDRVQDTYDLYSGSVVLLYTRFFEYDLHRVIEVFRRVSDQVPDVQFLVVGEGRDDERQRFAELASEAGLSRLIHFTGWVDPELLPAHFLTADVAVYPLDDTLLNRAKCPAKLTELMLAGRCIVAEDVGQVGEYIVHGESGLLSRPDDPQLFAENVVQALESPDHRERFGNNARRRIIDNFNWDRITDKLEVIYQEKV